MLSLKTKQVSVGREIYPSDERSDVRRIIRRMKSFRLSELSVHRSCNVLRGHLLPL